AMNDDDPSSSTSLSKSSETNLSRWWRRVAQRLGGGPRNREDLLEVLKDARTAELMDGDALSMFEGILTTSETQVRDIMVPRAQMVIVERTWTLDKLVQVTVDSGHSRFPVIGDSRDEVVGVLLAKDLLRFTAILSGTFDLTRWLRPVQFVPESKRVNVLLKEFKRGRNHMAIVVDEYGGVAGLVTIEDVLEQIVGEIDDEYDHAEAARILKQDDRRFLVSGLTPMDEFNSYFAVEFPTHEFDTIGGLVTHRFGHMPKRGESIRLDKFNFNVQRADSRRVHLLMVTIAPA
ncbi:MAG TPA: transporter associated domain-containing protein, partial [Nevskiaceae bacterium]|nr:transporter associated domain-containing protein [Nevskiaceae bacterium]